MLNKDERNYSATVWSVQKLLYYLEAVRFIIILDWKDLKILLIDLGDGLCDYNVLIMKESTRSEKTIPFPIHILE